MKIKKLKTLHHGVINIAIKEINNYGRRVVVLLNSIPRFRNIVLKNHQRFIPRATETNFGGRKPGSQEKVGDSKQDSGRSVK